MDQLLLHIEYTLHHHNCVIVPGLGGFVVNTTPSWKEDLSIFHSPECELVFNRSLAYNDGLLTESYMRVENIPFELASQKIDNAVKEINKKLRDERYIDLGELGSFELNENNGFIYNSSPFVRPEFYGASTASLKPIIQFKSKTATIGIEPKAEKKPKTILPKIGISAAVAAVVALLMLILPMQDTVIRHQTAQMLTESNIFSKNERPKIRNNTDLVKNIVAGITSNDASNTSPEENSNKYGDADNLKERDYSALSTKQFYIIVGVYEVRGAADKMIDNLRSDGYTNCNTIDKPTRIDVYAASFSTREEANKVSKELRQNPKYKDAWVLEK